MSGMEHWMSRPSQLGPAHLGSTSSSSSSTQSGGSGNAGRLADSLAHTHISHLAHSHLAHTHLGQSHHQQSHLSQSHHGKLLLVLSVLLLDQCRAVGGEVLHVCVCVCRYRPPVSEEEGRPECCRERRVSATILRVWIRHAVAAAAGVRRYEGTSDRVWACPVQLHIHVVHTLGSTCSRFTAESVNSTYDTV